MSRGKRKNETIAGKGTPSESDRRVLKRAEPDEADRTGPGKDAKGEPVDLSLHGEDVERVRDELPSTRKTRREREGKIPSAKTKR